MPTESMPVDATIIIGGGIIGIATAYYLSLHQPTLAVSSKIHIVDSAPSLLLSASGFSGGFIAESWFSSRVASLGALSFRLHKELAEATGGHREWGYSQSTAYSLNIDDTGVSAKITPKSVGTEDWLSQGSSRAEASQPIAGSDDGSTTEATNNIKEEEEEEEEEEMLNRDGTPTWIRKQPGGTLEVIDADGCAQVEPRELCEWLLQEIEKRGVKIHLSTNVTKVTKDDNDKISGLHLTTPHGETDMPCKNLIITSGAWTSKVFNTLFPNSKTDIGIEPLAGYSIVVRSPRYSTLTSNPTSLTSSPSATATSEKQTCHAIFSTPSPNWTYAPEAITRTTKTGEPEIYIAGLNDTSMPLPSNVTALESLIDESKIKDLKRTAVLLAGLSDKVDDPVTDDLEVVRTGLCLRPVSRSGRPVVTKLTAKQLGKGMEMSGDGAVFVAAGHGPWGISLSLGTGLVVAELVLGRKTSADIEGLGC